MRRRALTLWIVSIVVLWLSAWMLQKIWGRS